MTLRAVTPEKRLRRSPKPITKAADEGDRRAMLVALRSRIARTIDDPETPARDLAALSRRVMDIAETIEEMDKRVEEEEKDRARAAVDAKWEAV